MLHRSQPFHIDRKVVIEMGLPFNLGQLCNRETTQLVDDRNIDQAIFAQHEDEIRFDMATFAIILYDNVFVQHTDAFLVVPALP